MTVINICVCDFWNQRHFLTLMPQNLHIVPLQFQTKMLITVTLPSTYDTGALFRDSKRHRKMRRLRQNVDGVNAYYLLRELLNYIEYRKILLDKLAVNNVQLLWLQLIVPPKQIIDYKWNYMLSHTLWKKIEVDYLMSWLSTLGGGYSALGEQFNRCAETAGKISLRQLAIGIHLGDPFLQARCILYFSISLIQRGRLRSAKYLIRSQHKFARTHAAKDQRLINMCRGIWLRLRHEYRQRHIRHQSLPQVVTRPLQPFYMLCLQN